MGIFTVIIIVLFAKNKRELKKKVFNSTLFHIDLIFFYFLLLFFHLFSFFFRPVFYFFLSCPVFSSFFPFIDIFLVKKESKKSGGRKKVAAMDLFSLFGLLYTLKLCWKWCRCWLCSALSATIVEPIRNIYWRCGLIVSFFCSWYSCWCIFCCFLVPNLKFSSYYVQC